MSLGGGLWTESIITAPRARRSRPASKVYSAHIQLSQKVNSVQ